LVKSARNGISDLLNLLLFSMNADRRAGRQQCGKAHWAGCTAAEYGLSHLAACKIIFLAAFAASFAT